MLHIVRSSPFGDSALSQCLAYRAPDDALLLIQDGVIAAAVAPWAAALADSVQQLYVLQEDLQARGLQARVGTPIDMAAFVRLVVDQGSPLRW